MEISANNLQGVCGCHVRTTTPPFFQLAKRLVRRKLRGSSRLLALTSRHSVVQYDLGDGYHLTVPLFREDNCCDRNEVLSYEAGLLGEMSSAARGLRDATLIDCGADIGMFSVLLCRRVPAIGRVVAFEPNAEVLPFLNRNLAMLPHAALMIGHAVGNLNGAGRLERSAADSSDHARYLVPDPNGSIRVITIDSLNLSGDVIVKIDVEGGEYAVLEGAANTIRNAPRSVISLEAHSLVAARTGRDPVELLRFLNSIRPFRFVVTSDDGAWELPSLDRPMFQPGIPITIWNVVASAGM